MGRYLDQFKDKIGSRQTQQILRLLNKQRNAGQIRSIDEFGKRLESLMRELTSTSLKPTLSLFPAEANKKIDSETMNFMLDRIKDDLEASFEEANNIAEVQTAHIAIVKDLLFKNLKAGLAELETKIALYEFLNKNRQGFSDAISSTFRETQLNRTDRKQEDAASALFIDPRRLNSFNTNEDASVDLVGEKLTLAIKDKTFFPIRSVKQLFDADTKQSELIVEPANNYLSNIADGQKGTYWIQSLLFEENPQFVDIKLELNLGITKSINTIEIEPVFKKPFYLTDISYLTNHNTIESLNLASLELQGPVSFNFTSIASSKIFLTFRNKNPIPIEFEHSNKDTLLNQALGASALGQVPSMQQVAEDLDALLVSGSVKTNAGVILNTIEAFHGYEFTTGFDNIRIGFSNYQDKSIYTSRPIVVTNKGILGLKVDEKRPYEDLSGQIAYTDLTYDNTDINEAGGNNSRNFLGSIEYWIAKQDFDSYSNLLRTNVFPILPLGVTRVHHERLLLTEKSSPSLSQNDLGTLMFFTNISDGDLKIYKNFQLLTNETGNIYATEGWKIEPEPSGSLSFRTPNNDSRMKFKVKIINPRATDIFTVTYTPLTSSTSNIPQTLSAFNSVGGLQVVDLVGDLSARSTQEQVIVFERLGETKETLESKIYLLVILRQNTANTFVSPILEEYTLLTGSQDILKFEEV